MRSTLIAVAVAVLGAFTLYRFTIAHAGVECEACMVFRGRDVCRTVSAATQDEAEYQAVANACAILAVGVTASLECQRTPPTRMICR